MTEEFHPGFRNSVAAYTVSLLNPKVIRDLRPARARPAHRRAARAEFPARGSTATICSPAKAGPKARSPSSAPRDAERYDAFNRELDAVRRRAARTGAAGAAESHRRLDHQKRRASSSKRARSDGGCSGLPTERLRQVYDLFTKSAADYLDGWFEGELLKALFGFDAIVGNYASPYTPGSAYVLLHHAFGEVNGKQRRLGPRHRRHGRDHAGDGRGRAQAMAWRSRPTAPVREVLIESDRVGGVVLADGRVDPQPRRGRQRQSASCSTRRLVPSEALDRRLSASHAALALRLRHLPDERRAFAPAELFGIAGKRAPPIITPPASSWRQASATWIAPMPMRAGTAGAANRSSRC